MNQSVTSWSDITGFQDPEMKQSWCLWKKGGAQGGALGPFGKLQNRSVTSFFLCLGDFICELVYTLSRFRVFVLCAVISNQYSFILKVLLFNPMFLCLLILYILHNTHSPSHTYSHIHIYTHIDTCTLTHTDTHLTHTHIFTYTYKPPFIQNS